MQQRKEPTRSHDMEEPQQQKEDTDVELNDEDNDERTEHAKTEALKQAEKWQNAANGKPREPLGNGYWPCIGYNGIACNTLAQLSEDEEKCFSCKMHENPPLDQHCKDPHGHNSKD